MRKWISRLFAADLDHIFHTAKDKDVAVGMLKFLDTLVPGAAEKARAQEIHLARGDGNSTHDELRR